MSMHTNLKDIGWMCHVVPLRKKKDPIPVPPISQIPNIGCHPADSTPVCEPKLTFKSTDSPYVQLSKMGGRSDLLCFRENEPYRGPPVPYCRCDWYYLEDNALEEQQKSQPTEKHTFKVPFYMTHQEFKRREELPKPIGQATPPPLPTPMKPKKCKKLPANRPGYAEYNRKMNKVGIAYTPVARSEPIRFPKSHVVERDSTNISKLLAHGYQTDYDAYRKQWREVANFYEDKQCCMEKPLVLPKKPKSLGPKGNELTC
ncbi:hypothetical protein D915_005670 [Fasciola hepatica]|uniref:Uncharacterized protein n=1 Tax=Fasciola hepatica TaxID=6192 RepID=A0A4E0RYA3_FASHE|nr:hypothetical protein D915_005670 [Fasciola hepatica]